MADDTREGGKRIQLYAPLTALREIDHAARHVGESRSEFMVAAALDRAQEVLEGAPSLTGEQRRAVVNAIRDALESV